MALSQHSHNSLSLPLALPTTLDINVHFYDPSIDANFLKWYFHFQTMLNIHRLSKSDLLPESDPSFEQWYMADQLVMSWILATISPSIENMIQHYLSMKRVLGGPQSKVVSKLCNQCQDVPWQAPQNSQDTNHVDERLFGDHERTEISLHTAGTHITDDVDIAFVLNYLDNTYKGFISITHLVPFKSFEALHHTLLVEEDIIRRANENQK